MDMKDILNEIQILEEIKNNICNKINKINELNKQKKELLQKVDYYTLEIEKLHDLYKREKEIKQEILKRSGLNDRRK